jgi:RimJ/RimL family protein N-acetyltransferase
VGQGKALLRAVLPPALVSLARRARHRRSAPDAALLQPDRPLREGVTELRPIEKRHLDLIERGARDSEIRRRFGLSRRTPSEYLLRYLRASSEGTAVALVICDLGGESFGLVTVELRHSGRAEVGYWVLPEGRGHGRATRAVRLVSRWALSQRKISRLELSTSPENVASQRVAERVGFRREGVLRSYHEVSGRREDAVFFSLLRGDLGGPEPRTGRAHALALGWLLDRAEILEHAAGAGLKLSGSS